MGERLVKIRLLIKGQNVFRMISALSDSLNTNFCNIDLNKDIKTLSKQFNP